MILKFFTVSECRRQLIHNLFLTICKIIRMFPVDGREIAVAEWVFFSVRQCNRAFLRVNPVKKCAVFHVEFFVLAHQFSF